MKMGNVIGRFQYDDGSHSPLSNFYPSPFHAADLDWPTVEHYYQAMKTLNLQVRMTISRIESPGQAKRAGRNVSLRPDWEAVKIGVMRDALELKFDMPENVLGQYLLSTGDAFLVEGNTWNDTFWGVCKNQGRNWLGHLLMGRRAELRGML